MNSGEMSIGELADAAGITRRAVRFYVQQEILPAPTGVGRGRHYDQTHLTQLRKIQELQAAGHSLDAIKRILDGQPLEAANELIPPTRPRANLSAELWTRLRIVDGVELHFDLRRRNLNADELHALSQAIRAILDQKGKP